MTTITSPNPQAAPLQDEPQKLNIADFGTNFESLTLRGDQGQPPSLTQFKADDQGPVPREIMLDIDSLSDAEVQTAVDEFVALSKGDLVPGLYASEATGITREGWDAVTEFASEEVASVSQIVTDYVEMGAESLDFADVQTIANASVQLGSIEKLQARLGLENTPQGQIISIASGSINVMSQAIAGAIVNPSTTAWADPGPIGGLGHLSDLAGTFETLGETLKDPSTTFLNAGVGTITNIEIFNDNELNMPEGIIDRGNLEGLSENDLHNFETLIDPETPMVGEFRPEPLPVAPPVEEIEGEEEPIVEEGETPFFESSTGVPVDETAVNIEQAPLQPAYVGEPIDIEKIDETLENVELPDFELPADSELVELEGTGELVEMEGGGDIVVEVPTDAPAPWYEQSVSRNLVPLDGVGGRVSELYNAVVENAAEIVGERGFLETGVMTGFTAFLEELGEAISEITVGDAADISDVVAPLLLDLDQGQFMLEQMGLTDSALYGATQVMTEVVGSVYYAGQVAQNDPERGAELLKSIQPQVQLLGEVFGSIVDTFAETGELNFDIKTFFGEARALAGEIYESIYELNDVAAADAGDNE